MSVKEISTFEELEGYLNENITIVYFHAKWCKPCTGFKSRYEELSKEYINYKFFKADIDEAIEMSEYYNISILPTFILLNKSKDSQYLPVKGIDNFELKLKTLEEKVEISTEIDF